MVVPHQSDQDRLLIERIRRGDAAAFESMFNAYFDPVCAFAWRYVESTEVAEDLAQNVFMQIWRSRSNWNPRGSLKTYLYGAIRNEALSYRKHQAVIRRQAAAVPYEQGSPVPMPDEELTYQELVRSVDAFIAHLPERRREIFVLHRQHGLTYREIAEVMSISIHTVETQIGRVLEALRRMLSDLRVL